ARRASDRYATQGSDWGISVATHLALQDFAHMTALHLNGCPGTPVPPAENAPRPATPPPVSSNLGYQEIQTTRPQALGQGLADSPVGQAAAVLGEREVWTRRE